MSEAEYTPVDQIPKLVSGVREAFRSNKLHSLQFRREQLLALARGLKECQQDMIEAAKRDLRKPSFELIVSEIGLVTSEITTAEENLESWCAPQSVSTDLAFKFDKAQIRKDPLGVVLIIGAWNYPYQVTLGPLVGAIAAGNTAVLKPSELAFNCAKVMKHIVEKYLHPDCYVVVNGGVAQTSKLLECRFDHIVYTGGAPVGKIIMSAAAKHLTPVTLELGGKSPVVIDEDCNLENAARRIAWGRFSNAGQTCVAPDYVLCPPHLQLKLAKLIQQAIAHFYGSDPQQSNDYARIINARHFARIQALMQGDGNGKLIAGGQTDEKDLYIAPTVFIEADAKSPLMQEEIFGPVLPMVSVHTIDDAINFINDREKPLALYVFTNNSKHAERVMSMTSSGGVVINDVLMHVAVDTLPFGGCGNSGMGAYHGKHSFDMLSHSKSTLIRTGGMEFVNDVRYPPYSDQKLSILKFVAIKEPRTAFMKALPYICLAITTGAIAYAAARQIQARFF